MTVHDQEAPTNDPPAAAVIRRKQSFAVIVGVKRCVGGVRMER